jgi:hypothetical protein
VGIGASGAVSRSGNDPDTEDHGGRTKTTNKLKMLVVTALAAATVGIGTLAIAPSASALPNIRTAYCAEIMRQYLHWQDAADTAERLFGRDYYLTKLYRLRAAKEFNNYRAVCS